MAKLRDPWEAAEEWAGAQAAPIAPVPPTPEAPTGDVWEAAEREWVGAPDDAALAAPAAGLPSRIWAAGKALFPTAFGTAATVGKIVATHPGRKLLGALGLTLDAPRRLRDMEGIMLGSQLYSAYDWTQGLFGGQTEMEIRGSLASGKIGYGEAWRMAESGGKIIETLAPKYAKRNPWKTKWLWGLGHEIVTDPLNVMTFFSPTKTGRALEGTELLARTLAGQAAAGQRALLQLTAGGPLVWTARRFMPKAAKYALPPTMTLIAAPRVVGLVGKAGRWIRHPLRMARGQGGVIDAIRFAKDVAAPRVAGEAGMEFLKINDALAGLQKSVDPDTWVKVMRAGEHLGKHPLEFAEYSDEVKKLAQHAYALVGEQKAIAVKYGIIGPEATELANFHRSLAMLERARGREVRRLAKELMPHVGAQEAKSLQRLSVQQGIANEINDELVGMADNLYDDGLNFIGTAGDLKKMRELNRAATKAQRNLASMRYRAMQLAEWKASLVLPAARARPAVGDPILRMVEPGEVVSATKPHGLYVTLGTPTVSPHAEGLPTARRWIGRLRPKRPLLVGTERIEHARFGWMRAEGSAGVLGLKKLVGGHEFARLARLSKSELLGELARKFPGPDYAKFYKDSDAYMVLEAYGAQKARAQGFDAILQRHVRYPEFSEAVVLRESALSAPLAPERLREIPVGKPRVGVPLTKKIEAYGRDIAKVEQAMGNQPNWMPHVLTEWGLRKVKARGGFARRGNLEGRMWTDQYNGFIQRRFVEDVVLETKSVVRAGRRVAVKGKRWLALDEIDKILQNPKIGTKAEWYATELPPHIKDQGGIWGAIERRFAKEVKPAERLGRFFKMDPTQAFAHTNNQILRAIRGKAFIQSVLSEVPDLASRKALPGWWRLRDVSASLANAYGDIRIHPDLGMELGRVYKQMFQPESFNRLVRVFDKATRVFKRSVTEPWFSYHVRNAYSDGTLMLYNGDVAPWGVIEDGYKGVFKKGKVSTSLYGDLPAEELNRAARSYGVLFGEQVEAGSRGWLLIPENMRRMGYFADRLKRGRSFFQAAMDTKKVLFDYSQLSDFERNYLRRVIPFWSWLRNNVRRQFTQLATDPAIVAHQMRMTQRTEVVEGVDSWTRNRGMIAMNPDEQTGEERLLVGLDFPMMDVTQLLDAKGGWQEWLEKASFRLNPLAKLGFAGREFIRGTGYFERPKVTTSFVKSLPDFAKKLMGVRREVGRYGEYWTISPRYDYLLKNMPTARFYSTARVLARKDIPASQRALGFFTGVREHRYRPWEVAERKRKREAREELRRLQRQGEVGIMPIPYRRRGAEISPAEFERIRRAAERR